MFSGDINIVQNIVMLIFLMTTPLQSLLVQATCEIYCPSPNSCLSMQLLLL